MRRPSAVALGFFDGVHIGHQKILQTAKQIAEKQGLAFAVMTFDPHPSKVVKPDRAIEQFITPLHEKLAIFSRCGVDVVYVVDFTQAFAVLSPREFIQNYVCGVGCKHVVAGFDFAYGFRGQGTMDTIVAHGDGVFDATKVEKIDCQGEKIGSTAIRQRLENGKVEEIPSFLGKAFEVKAFVDRSVSSRETVYVSVEKDYKLPKPGVYQIKVEQQALRIEGICEWQGEDFNGERRLDVYLKEPMSSVLEGDINIQWVRKRQDQKFGKLRAM